RHVDLHFALFLYSYAAHPALPSFLHDALPISTLKPLEPFRHNLTVVGNLARAGTTIGDHAVSAAGWLTSVYAKRTEAEDVQAGRSEEHTSELQSRENLVCRLLLEKKKNRLRLQ